MRSTWRGCTIETCGGNPDYFEWHDPERYDGTPGSGYGVEKTVAGCIAAINDWLDECFGADVEALLDGIDDCTGSERLWLDRVNRQAKHIRETWYEGEDTNSLADIGDVASERIPPA